MARKTKTKIGTCSIFGKDSLRFAPSVAEVVPFWRSLPSVVLERREMSAKLLKVHEVAERLRCSRWCVYAMARDGRLTAVRLSSRRLLFTQAAVEEAVRKAEHHPSEAGSTVRELDSRT
jgi:excisionase family DNA binding protein